MDETRRNYYGDLCTEMYELLHPQAPEDELNFYLSFAERGQHILEPLCGTGRFLVPFLERGFDISGVDLSSEMLSRLREKAPGARAVCADILAYAPEERFDYIFITSGSVSLFTDMDLCRQILAKMKDLLAKDGQFIFAVDTVASRCAEDSGYEVTASVPTADGLELVLRTRNHYDEESQTQFSPGIYELYRGRTLLRQEEMDFQTHLYRFGEMEQILSELGFTHVRTYGSFSKEPAAGDDCGMFLFVCGAD